MHPRPPDGLPSCLLNHRPGSLPGLSGGSSPGYSGDSSLRPPVDSPHGSSVGSLPGRLVNDPAGNPEGCRPISPGGSLPDSPAGRGAGRCPDHRPGSLPMYLGDGVPDATAAAAGRGCSSFLVRSSWSIVPSPEAPIHIPDSGLTIADSRLHEVESGSAVHVGEPGRPWSLPLVD